MILDEAFKSERFIKLIPNTVYQENRLVPVNTKVKKGWEVLMKIPRSTLKVEDMICCLVSPDKSQGVFIDESGREYIITREELVERLKFFNSKWQKKIVPRYTYRRGAKEEYENMVRAFVNDKETRRRYKEWISADGIVGEENLSEEYEIGKVYKAGKKSYMIVEDRGDRYLVLNNKGRKIEIAKEYISSLNLEKVEELRSGD